MSVLDCREMEGIKNFWPGVGYSYPSGKIHRYALELSEPLKNQLCIFSYTFQHRLDSAFGMRSASLAALFQYIQLTWNLKKGEILEAEIIFNWSTFCVCNPNKQYFQHYNVNFLIMADLMNPSSKKYVFNLAIWYSIS